MKSYAVKIGNEHFMTDPVKGGPVMTTKLEAAVVTPNLAQASSLRRQADQLGFKKARVVEVIGGRDEPLDV